MQSIAATRSCSAQLAASFVNLGGPRRPMSGASAVRDVSGAPLDVTAQATWQLSGVPDATVAADGTLTASQAGDVAIGATYQTHHARALAPLFRDGSGLVLGSVRRRVSDAAFRPIVAARVAIIDGADAGLITTTTVDGSYAFTAVAHPDENWLSLIMVRMSTAST